MQTSWRTLHYHKSKKYLIKYSCTYYTVHKLLFQVVKGEFVWLKEEMAKVVFTILKS